MKKVVASILIILLLWSEVFAFCGFYVAGAGAKLYNKSSQVIIARDGEKTVVTMESDFSGDVKQFAMVVPVPTVLKKEQIRVIDSNIFEKLDRYSAPRIVEYHDENPCSPDYIYSKLYSRQLNMLMKGGDDKEDDEDLEDNVKIEAQYEIGEYSIFILSAQESDGLTRWLTANNYSIPDKANEVLEPYIKNKLKFFVVKVNLDKIPAGGFTKLRPIQLEYEYKKFMLPIRLGMANAESIQDLTIYAFSRIGRVESSNYITVEMPTDRNIPLRIKDHFADFYKAVFNNYYSKLGKAAIFWEYAWDLSWTNQVKCDPCPSPPPQYAEIIKDAGVFWMKYLKPEERQVGWGDYQGDLYFTRLHVRYDREHFPDDIAFFHTPNKSMYQTRYVVTHEAKNNLNCPEGEKYLNELAIRKQSEETMLASLIGWQNDKNKPFEPPNGNKNLIPLLPNDGSDFTPPNTFPMHWIIYGLVIFLLIHNLSFLLRIIQMVRLWSKKLIS